MINTIKKESQYNKCLACNKDKTSNLLCKSCEKNPYKIEDLRRRLVEEGDWENFSKTYSTSYPEIKDDNTGTFWDKKFDSPEDLADQDSMTKEKIDFLISLLPKKKVKILDLGIGQGYLEQRLKTLGIKHGIYGIDISKKSIKRATDNFSGKFVVGDILKLEKFYKKNFFDVVIAIEVIEHIQPSKTLKLFRTINGLLKKNGSFIISTPLNENLRNKKINPSSHVRDYSIPTLHGEFQVSGFRVDKPKTFYAFDNFYSIKKLLARIFKNRWQPNNVALRGRKI